MRFAVTSNSPRRLRPSLLTMDAAISSRAPMLLRETSGIFHSGSFICHSASKEVEKGSRVYKTSLSQNTSCHPNPQKQIGTPAQLREPTRTPLPYSRPVTRSPRKTPESAKSEEGDGNAVICLWGSRATGAPLSPQADRASGPEWPRFPHSSLPEGRSGDPYQWTPLL